MARKRKPVKPRQLYIPVVPAEASWIESDSYDRRAWRELGQTASAINDLIEAGERLIPHFGALLQDLFFGLFKYNLVWNKPAAVRESAALNKTILEQLVPSPSFEILKTRTLLEEDKAVIAALVLGEQVLELVRSERLINRREMLDLWDLKHQEEELEESAAALKNADELERQQELKEDQKKPPGEENHEDFHKTAQGTEKQADAEAERAIRALKEAAQRGTQVAEARLRQKARMFADSLKHSDQGDLKRMQLRSMQLADEIDQVAQDSHDFSLEFGQGGKLSAGERLELGRRLARNKKLGELARLVGRFKQDARALRRKTLDRGVAEAYDVERGSEIGRLIPAELAALHHPGLKADFFRRLLEGTVLQYRLREDEQKGRGPMVVCIDCSSSMQGDKELWAKAVGLTLMDIARRQRRLFRAVLFSSGAETLKVIDLNRARRYQPELAKVVEMAEYFPGGGTDFQAPIDAAVGLLMDKRLKRGDIVVITDGECQVSPEWLEALRERKDELDFSIYAVLVDVGSSELSTLAQFSDRVSSVKQLTLEGSREIFLKI
ncbi:MAG TPA: VWA domain-containing protein [Candidatus Binataceae bacterium]|nr:VWA domain-containing protein [Candidatus Binataceae bacterium]